MYCYTLIPVAGIMSYLKHISGKVPTVLNHNSITTR